MNRGLALIARLFLVLLPSRLLLQEARAEWVETAKLTDELDGERDDDFGRSGAIGSGIAVVGTPYDGIGDEVMEAGSVTVFEWIDSEWIAKAKLVASDADAYGYFASSVAILDESVVVVGAPGDDQGAPSAGAVYLYRKSGVDGSWTEQAKLFPAGIAARDRFGWSLATQESMLVVGARADTSSSRGSVYVYTFSSGSHIWTEHALLTATNGSVGDTFGSAVAISENTLVVGAPRDDEMAQRSGSVYVFQFFEGVWTQQAKLTPADGRYEDYFGIAVTIEADTICVGSSNNVDGTDVGAVYTFVRDDDSAWSEHSKLVPVDSAPLSFFGLALVLKNGILVVGAYGHNSYTGAIYFFTTVTGAWTEQAQVVASDGDVFDYFGDFVAADDGVVAVGATGDSDWEGAAYVFEWTGYDSPSISPTVGPSMVQTEQPGNEPHPLRRAFCIIFFFLCQD